MKMKKVTHKDRYGNQVSYEYESDTKQLDITSLFEKLLDKDIPEYLEIPESSPIGGGVQLGFAPTHPGGPKGQDTVPAWLTPGEFVVNKEGMEDPRDAAMVEQINNKGRAKQMAKGGMMPQGYAFGGRIPPIHYQEGGSVTGTFLDDLMSQQLSDEDMHRSRLQPWGTRETNPIGWDLRENAINQLRMMGKLPQGYQEGGEIPEVPVSPTEALLKAREGFRTDVYEDTRGYPTVGHGHRLPDEYLQRIGETPFTTDQLNSMFYEDMESAEAAAKRNAKSYGVKWDDLGRREKTALTSMAFQLGEEGQKGFENMWTKLAAGDKEGAALEALDSDWATQTPQRAKDVYDSLTPNLGFNAGGPIYAYRGYDVAQQDAFDIEDPNADLSGGWLPPVYEADEISPMEQKILDQEALAEDQYPQRLAQQIAQAENMVAGGDGDDLGTAPAVPAPAAEEEVPWWEGITDWAFGEEGTAAARDRNASFNVKAAENNLAAAEENLAELEARIDAGEPVNEHTLQKAQEAVIHQEAKVEEANDIVGADAGDDLVESNVPGPEDDRVTLESLATSSEYEKEDNASKPSEKGQQHPDEVVSAGEEAAKQDPSKLETAKGFFKDAFKDLFDGKELARMALMYVGSRALGYSHGGSLNWAAKQYVNRLDAKASSEAAQAAQNRKDALDLEKSGKHTSASIAAYAKSGDLNDLVRTSAGTSFTPSGTTVDKWIDGKKVTLVQGKAADGSVAYSIDGKTVISPYFVAQQADFDEGIHDKNSSAYKSRRNDVTSQSRQRFEEISAAEDVADAESGARFTNIHPRQAADEYFAWAERNGLDAGSAEMQAIMGNAYRNAIQDSIANPDRKASSLLPFLESQMIRERTTRPELFQTGLKDGRPTYVDQAKMAKLDSTVNFIVSNSPRNLSADNVYGTAIAEWSKLDAEAQAGWNSGASKGTTGFFNFMNQNLKKIGKKAINEGA